MGTNRYKDRIFVTVPRRRLGIPATLNYVNLNCENHHNVPLVPYPSWELNALNGQRPEDPTDVNTPIVSVYRTATDACNRLWFVDTGILEYPTGRQQVQQGALVIIDLNTDRVIRRHPFTEDSANPSSTLADVTIDVDPKQCDNAYAYIPDLVNHNIVVYSWRENDDWTVHHNSFSFLPRGGDLYIGGFHFSWDDGIFSIVLDPSRKTAYFHAMASTEEFSVPTEVFKNRTLAARSYHGTDFKFIGDRGKDGQSSTHAMHKKSGVVFMAEVNRNGISCWNSNRPFNKDSYELLQNDANKMIYPGDLRVDNEDNVWVMTNSMPVFLYGQLDYSKINFRIWTAPIREAIRGTKCDMGRRH